MCGQSNVCKLILMLLRNHVCWWGLCLLENRKEKIFRFENSSKNTRNYKNIPLQNYYLKLLFFLFYLNLVLDFSYFYGFQLLLLFGSNENILICYLYKWFLVYILLMFCKSISETFPNFRAVSVIVFCFF